MCVIMNNQEHPGDQWSGIQHPSRVKVPPPQARPSHTVKTLREKTVKDEVGAQTAGRVHLTTTGLPTATPERYGAENAQRRQWEEAALVRSQGLPKAKEHMCMIKNKSHSHQ